MWRKDMYFLWDIRPVGRENDEKRRWAAVIHTIMVYLCANETYKVKT
jgi:hypothetical protein